MLALLPLYAAPSEPVVVGLVDALNTADAAKIESFLKQHGSPAMADTRFAAQVRATVAPSVPYKIIAHLDKDAAHWRTRVEDRNATRFDLTVGFESSKIIGFRITPVTLPEPSWATLSELAHRIQRESRVPMIAMASETSTELRITGAPSPPIDTLWHIGSIGKSITASIIARLIEQGKLDWNTTVAAALPGQKMSPEHAKITLHELMRHQSGLPAHSTFTGSEFAKIIGDAIDAQALRKRFVDLMLSEPLGEKRFRYSNAGYALLGYIAETVSGVPFEKLAEREVFIPLGLKTAQAGSDGEAEAHVQGHLPGQPPRPHTLDERLGRMIGPAGDYWMSVQDLVRYGRAHLDGLNGKGTWLKPATIAKLHEPDGSYACGWVVAGKLHHHNGSNGTFVAEIALDREHDRVLVAIINQGHPEPNPALRAIQAMLAKKP